VLFKPRSAGRKKALAHRNPRFSLPRSSATEFRLALRAAIAKALVETIYTAATIDNFLFASEERVAIGANVDMQILTQSGTRLDFVTTAATGRHGVVLGMYICFHQVSSLSLMPPTGPCQTPHLPFGVMHCLNKKVEACAKNRRASYQTGRD
jgi:hypothetical protein